MTTRMSFDKLKGASNFVKGEEVRRLIAVQEDAAFIVESRRANTTKQPHMMEPSWISKPPLPTDREWTPFPEAPASVPEPADT